MNLEMFCLQFMHLTMHIGKLDMDTQILVARSSKEIVSRV